MQVATGVPGHLLPWQATFPILRYCHLTGAVETSLALHALQCSDKEVSDLLPENWRVHVIDEPDEKWIMENLLHNSLTTKVNEVWARSYATYKNIQDFHTMLGHTDSEQDLAS